VAAPVAKVGTYDAEAYQCYLRGRHRLGGLTPADLHAAAEFFEKALPETLVLPQHMPGWRSWEFCSNGCDPYKEFTENLHSSCSPTTMIECAQHIICGA
jgi:hypothetical protein